MSEKSNYLLRYTIITYFLTIFVVLWAALFTYANGFTKLSFSYDNDIYEIYNDMLDNVEAVDNIYAIDLPLFLEEGKMKANYVRLYINDIVNEEPALVNILGGVMTEEYEVVFQCNDIPLHTGENDILIPRDDINLLSIIVIGPETKVIQRVELLESAKGMNVKKAIPLLLGIFTVATIVFVALMAIYTRHRIKTGTSR